MERGGGRERAGGRARGRGERRGVTVGVVGTEGRARGAPGRAVGGEWARRPMRRGVGSAGA